LEDKSGKKRKLNKMEVLKWWGSGRNMDVDDKEELKKCSGDNEVFGVCCLDKTRVLLRLKQPWKPWIFDRGSKKKKKERV